MIGMFRKNGFAPAWGVLFLVLCFAHSEWFIDPGLFPKFLLWAVVMFVMAIVLRKRPVPALGAMLRHNIPLLFFAIYLVASIPGLLVSHNRADGLFFWLRDAHVLLFAVLVMAWFESNEKLGKAFSVFMVITLFVLAQWGVVEWVLSLDGTVLTHRGTYAVKTTLGHRNLYGQFLMLGMAFILPLALQRTRWTVFALITVFLLVFLGVVLLARSVWLVLGVELLILAVAWFFFRPGGTLHVSRRAWMIAAAALVVALFALALTIDQWYTIWHHFETAATTGSGTTRDRLLLVSRSWELFAEQPWTGIGAGMWKIDIMQFSQLGMQSENAALYYQRPHNDYVWVFSESGLLAGVAFAASHLTALAFAVRNAVHTRSLAALSMAIAWAAYILISLTNFPKERMEFSLVLAIMLALSVRPGVLQRRTGRWFSGVMAAMALALIFLYGMRLKSEYLFTNAFRSRIAGDWPQYLEGIQKAEGPFLQVDGVSLPLAWHEGLARFNTGDVTTACAAFEEALSINSYHPEVWNNLGVCASHEGNTSLALERFYKAVENTPAYPKAWLNIAAMQYTAGDRRGAFETFVRADPHTENDLYDQLGTRLSIDSLNVLVDDFPERKLMLTVQAFRNTPEWALSLIRKAAINRIEFREQVLIDACYHMLRNCDNEEDCAEARAIKEKYIPDAVLNLDV